MSRQSIHLDKDPEGLLVGLPMETPPPVTLDDESWNGCPPRYHSLLAMVRTGLDSEYHGVLLSERRYLNSRGEEKVTHELQVLPRVPGDEERPWLSRKQSDKILLRLLQALGNSADMSLVTMAD